MNKSKKCLKCSSIKLITEYSKNVTYKDGHESNCKPCAAKLILTRNRTKLGVIKQIYLNQTIRSRKKWGDVPGYTKDELINMLLNNALYLKLYDKWVKSGYNSELKPSIDRKNDYIGYTMDNIQLMTWKENREKGHLDIVEGRNNKMNKAVNQFSLGSVLIKSFYSVAEAKRQTGISDSSIISCCKGNLKTAGSFIWAYA